jgi:phosphate-selective porin
MEGTASSSEIATLERSALSEAIGWSDYRDLGAMLKYQKDGWKTELGAFNGEGPNTSDVNRDKDFAGRIAYAPIKSLHLGLAGYRGYGKAARYLNERWGAEFAWLPEPWVFKAEFAAGHGATSASSSPGIRTAYGLAGWTFRPKFQAVARFDWWDPDTGSGRDIQKETTLGLNWLIDGHDFKVQAAFTLRSPEDPVKPYGITRLGLQTRF